MNCKKAEKYIALFDDEFNEELKLQLRDHIKSCNGCSKLYGSLNNYRKVLDTSEKAEAPAGFEKTVLERIERRSKISNNSSTLKYGIIAASIAVLMILIYFPSLNNEPELYEINFSLKSEKKGKGPADMIDFNKIHEKINELLKSAGAVVESKESNEATGYYNNILISIPVVNLSGFVNGLNEISALDLNLPEEFPEAETYYFKINFDMINFTSANITGDGKDEIIVQFISGAYKGHWVIYERTDADFNRYEELTIVRKDSSLLANYNMRSGDFNGDGYDDILLYEHDNFRGLTLRILINNKNLGLVEASDYSLDLNIPDNNKFVAIELYDVDNDGTDDLLWISADDSNFVTIQGINMKTGYAPIKTEPVGDHLPNIFPGEYTGDKQMDVVLKQTWNGESILLAGIKDKGFNEPVEFRRSFQGDYYIWSGDYNGDGLTDLFVKDGGPFLPGTFYLIVSEGNGKFKGAPSFKLTYPELD